MRGVASRTSFVTGSSTGLGRAAALLFASRGWKVVATMRDPSKETELGGVPGITLLPLDVTKPAQIAEVVYEAATDEQDRLTYVAGADAKEMYSQRLAVGIDQFRKTTARAFLG